MRLGTKQLIIIFILISLVFGNDQKLHLVSVDFNRSINCIRQDSFGYLWLGTKSGLYRYDGHQTKTFKIAPYNLNSISDDNISDIEENNVKELIIGTQNGGINIYNLKSEKFNYFRSPEYSTQKITSVLSTETADWFGTDSDLFILENINDTLQAVAVGLNNEVSDIANIDENNILVATKKDGFYIINCSFLGNWNFQKTHFLGDCSINFVYEVINNQFLIGTTKGFYIYNVQSQNLDLIDQSKFTEKIYSIDKNSIVKDDSGNIWIGSGYNLYKVTSVEDVSNIQINAYELDIDNRFSTGINTLYFDKSGVLWIGFKGKGLYKYYPKRNFSHLKLNQGLMSNIIFSVTEYNSHSVLLGTHHGLFLYDFDNQEVQRLPNTEALNFQVITALYKDKNMNLWCGTNEGLFKLTADQKLVHYENSVNELSSLSSNFITSITGCQNDDGDIWIGTREGLNRYRVKYDNFIHYLADNNNKFSLPGNDIEHICLSNDNNLWIGTADNGLSLLRSGEIEKFEPKFINYRNNSLDKKSISNDKITYIAEDIEKQIWVGTQSGGLNKIDSLGNFQHFMETNGLIDNDILSIIPTNENILWLSTPIGISKFDVNSNISKNYYFKDGIKDGDYLTKSACITKNSEIIFGSKSGFTHFHPEKIQNNTKLAVPQIAGFYIFNDLVVPATTENSTLKKTINMIDYIELGHKENVISMDICALHYVSPEDNSLAYFMEGVDNDWQGCENNSYITYSNLKPGIYTFHLKASNNDNVWNPEERILNIKVIAPFYSTIWFEILIALSILSLIYIFLKYRLSNITKRKIALEKQIWEKNKKNEELNKALKEVEKLKNQLQNENTFLKSEITTNGKHKNIVTDSKNMKNILHQVEIASGADPTILILGESGTGKDLLAKAIHQTSGRANECFVKVDCAALPPNLIESELFGHEKGAFTGANKRKLGRFELANGGTIFLDEIGELPIKVQQKLLRVLQSGEFERLGNSVTLKTNTRIIAATNRNLEEEVKNGQFREDLFYRLNVFPINLPPLRDRIEDVPLLVQHFVSKYSEKFNKNIEKIPQNVITKLMSYTWPGNIRELENIIQRSIIVSQENILELGDWFAKDANKETDYSENIFLSLEDMQKKHIEKILEYTKGKVSGENGAAEILKINPKTLFSRIKKLNINN